MKFVKYGHGIWQPYFDPMFPTDAEGRAWETWKNYMSDVFRDQYNIMLENIGRSDHEIY